MEESCASAEQKILIVCPSWVGDMVMAQSLFQVLRERHPEASLDALGSPWSLPLLESMPEIGSAYSLPIGHGELKIGLRRRIARELGQQGYSQAIVLPNSFKSALIPYWAGIPLRTGWLGEMRYGLLNDTCRLDPQALPMTVQRFVALGGDRLRRNSPPAKCPAPRFVANPEAVGATLKALAIERDHRKVLALCPGAEYGPAKRWPARSFGELAASWINGGGNVWLLGSGRDRKICDQVNDFAGGGCLNLASETGLAQAVHLLSLADGVVCNDSGLMHVAAALDRPLVAVYGASDPKLTPPLNRRHRIAHLPLECGPCFKRRCPKGTNACLEGITVQQVSNALREVTESETTRGRS